MVNRRSTQFVQFTGPLLDIIKNTINRDVQAFTYRLPISLGKTITIKISNSFKFHKYISIL